MKKVRWIIQDNLIAENDRNQFQEACDNLGIPHKEIIVTPFSKELPNFPIDDDHENIYYGSTTLMNNIYEKLDKPIGLFYDHETFSMNNYINQWGEYMLNAEARLTTIEEFLAEDNAPEDNWFIRPDGDGKEFDGQVAKFKNISSWMNRVMQYDVNLDGSSKIIVGPAYNIGKEWRNFIVDGKVVTSSRYRNNFRLSKSSEDIPEDMIKFAEDRCKEYKPHDVFAMDIAQVKDEDGTEKYYIIECGCMNSVGFYHADINKYVESLTKYVENGRKN